MEALGRAPGERFAEQEESIFEGFCASLFVIELAGIVQESYCPLEASCFEGLKPNPFPGDVTSELPQMFSEIEFHSSSRSKLFKKASTLRSPCMGSPLPKKV